MKGPCPNDTNGDGNSGRPACPHCGDSKLVHETGNEMENCPVCSPDATRDSTPSTYEKLCAEETARRLSQSPAARAQAISTHYLAHVAIASDLRKLLEYRSMFGSNREIDDTVDRLVKMIEDDHVRDFGTAIV